ncbi:MAG: single-stranded DNA-binding protein [Acidobacteriota bacterium]|jgi:single-strand DNA-binding protein|nr:single-stranded DNA-binding protein [Acidobacteriota bacterium]
MSHVRSLNRVILVGRAGKDPEVTVMAGSGQQLAKFSLATNEGYFDKNSNAWKDLPTEWHNIVAWRALAQKVEKGVGKGDMLLVEGSIRTRKWKDKSGQDRSTTEITADNIVVLDRRKDGASSSASSYPSDRSRRDAFPEAGAQGMPPFAGPAESDEPGFEEDPF